MHDQVHRLNQMGIKAVMITKRTEMSSDSIQGNEVYMI